LFSCALPELSGRHIGEMLALNLTGNIRVMIAKSYSQVLSLKFGCFTKEAGTILEHDVQDLKKKLMIVYQYEEGSNTRVINFASKLKRAGIL
jgi:hypothetical protein